MRVAVIGVGLIGGSVALAARERLGATVTGWDPDGSALGSALSLRAVDIAASSAQDAVADADAVFVAAPVDALPAVIETALAAAPARCVVTDVGSTKRGVVAAASDPRFVGGHPLAGAETGGVQHARADLFVGATWFLTPGPRSAPEATTRLTDLITGLGAVPQPLDPSAHDRLMAIVSQLPHVFANILVTELAAHQAIAAEGAVAGGATAGGGAAGDGATAGAGATAPVGPSFRDATRVAGADPELWTSIFFESRDVLATVLASSISYMETLRSALVANDRDAVQALVEVARTASRSLTMPQADSRDRR